MGRLRIHCDNCGGEWDVYHRDDWKKMSARTCPVCGESISPDTWKGVLRGFHELEDASIELVKDHSQYHKTLFTVDYISDSMYPNRKENRELRDIREDLEGIKRTITSIFSI